MIGLPQRNGEKKVNSQSVLGEAIACWNKLKSRIIMKFINYEEKNVIINKYSQKYDLSKILHHTYLDTFK